MGSFTWQVEGVPIFVKQIPLNELEGSLEWKTSNAFDLPLYYQYGVGSTGFNVWREALSQKIVSQWVLDGECELFPLLYHVRILPRMPTHALVDDSWLVGYIDCWNASQAIGKRLQAIKEAKWQLVLFLEYIPRTLKKYLEEEGEKDPLSLEKAVERVDRQLQETVAFLKKRGMIHFDAHFHNIQADDERVYFSDFGLATSLQFELSQEEHDFYDRHVDYDRYYVAWQLTRWILLHYYGKEKAQEALKAYSERREWEVGSDLPAKLLKIVQKYARTSWEMGPFLQALVEDPAKLASYPIEELERIWHEDVDILSIEE